MAGLPYKFGEFELDRARFELRRNGQAARIERIPLELLLLLAENNGAIVSRQQIVDRLWGKDVFVDTEHGINTAIRKIRQALKDDPENPRFIQTVMGKGYRFVAEKSRASQSPEPMEGRTPRPLGGPEVSGRSPATAAPPRISPASNFKLRLALTLCLLLASALTFLFRNRLFASAHAPQIHSLAVLPLANLSGDPAQDYFADGMTDELITALAKNRNLRIVSRTSAMQYKDAKRPLPEIARELNVDGILEGSIERTPNGVHMTVQLIYAPTDTHMWAESYDCDLNQTYSLPEQLSETVAKEVKAATSPAPRQRYISPEAHEAYLHGRYFWFTFDTEKTLPYFEKAIQLQPDYAAAWAGLADTYAVQADNFPPQEIHAKAGEAARKAVELDDSLPEAHLSLGAWYFGSWDLLHADSELRRALDLNPNYAESYYLRHYILLALNRPDEALQEEKRAVELDPFARPGGLGHCYIQMRQFDAAISEFRMQFLALPNDPYVHSGLSLAYRLKGMAKESQQEFEKRLQLEHNPEGAAAARRIYARGGPKAVAQWEAGDAKALSRERYVSPWEIAEAVADTHDKEETLKYLEAAYHERSPSLVSIQNEPVFDFLHSDPRYHALVKKIGLALVP
jgi:TolB-like protein/DNA-binding winged helix-turn-helix (wHTH) protein/Flp pilus assembly protein TadD